MSTSGPSLPLAITNARKTTAAKPNQTRLTNNQSQRRTRAQAGFRRLNAQLISVMASGIDGMPSCPPRMCILPLVDRALGAVVMGSLVKIPPIIMPVAATNSSISPIYPIVDLSCPHVAEIAHTLAIAREKNASCIAQPNLPIAYSLTMRHEGSYSDFIRCKVASNTKNNAEAQNVMPRVTEMAIVDAWTSELIRFLSSAAMSPQLPAMMAALIRLQSFPIHRKVRELESEVVKDSFNSR